MIKTELKVRRLNWTVSLNALKLNSVTVSETIFHICCEILQKPVQRLPPADCSAP